MITLYYYVVSKLVKKQFALIYLTGQISSYAHFTRVERHSKKYTLRRNDRGTASALLRAAAPPLREVWTL